jgi:hypothetical protein
VKLGAEPKKIALLAGLLVAAVVIFYMQMNSTPDAPAPRTSAPPKTPPAARQLRATEDDLPEGRSASRARVSQQRLTEFRPTLKRSNPNEALDPTKIDPTLRADLLAKVRGVQYSGVERNLFQFGAPKPKAPPAVNPTGPLPKPAPKPGEPGGPEAAAPPKPTAPPLTMKYFGFVNRPGDPHRRAFLLDGEDVFVAVEGELIKRRYRVVRIGVNSLVVEDIEFKSEQTLPLQET